MLHIRKYILFNELTLPKFILLLVIVSLLLTALVEYAFADKYAMGVKVINDSTYIGISPTKTSLDFGELSPLASQTRYVTLKNSGGSAAYISVFMYGDVAPMVKVSKNNFFLEPGKEIKLEFSIYIPPSAQFRYYTGGVVIFRFP